MEVEYSLTIQDIEVFARYHRKHGFGRKPPRLWKRILLYFGLGLPLVVLIQVFFFFGPKFDPNWVEPFLCGWLVACLLMFLVNVWQGKAFIQSTRRLHDNEETQWIFAPTRMAIHFDGFTVTSEYQRATYSWSVCCRIGVTDDHAFFYTTQSSAYIVPRRAFADNQHFEKFVVLARQYQRGLPPQEPKSTGIIAGLPPEPTAITSRDAP